MRLHRSAIGFIVALCVALASPASTAAWWNKAIDATGKVTRQPATAIAKKATALAEKAAALRKAGIANVHPLTLRDGQLIALGPNGAETLIASAAAGSALTLTDAGQKLIRQAQLLIAEADFSELRPIVEHCIRVSGKPAHILYADGQAGQILLRKTAGNDSLFVEKYPGLFASADHLAELEFALAQPLRVDRTKVLSLLDESDADILSSIDNAVGELHTKGGAASPPKVTKFIEKQGRGTVFIVGHVEGEKFVIRDSAGRVRSEFHFTKIEELASKNDVSLVFLGCSSAVCSKSTGFVQQVNAAEIAESLQSAIRQPTIGQSLSIIAGKNSDLFLSETLVGPVLASIKTIKNAEAVDRRIANSYQVVRVATIAKKRTEELEARIVPFLPSWLQYTYFGGLFFLLFSLRSLLREWRGMRRPAPAFNANPYKRVLVEFIRKFGFIILMPFFTILIVFAQGLIYAFGVASLIFVSGWSGLIALCFGFRWSRLHRQEVQDEPLQFRYLAVPVALIFASLPVWLFSFILEVMGARAWVWSIESGSDLFLQLLKCLTVGIACHYGLRWLHRNKPSLAPSIIFHYITAAPIFWIEYAVSRTINYPNRL